LVLISNHNFTEENAYLMIKNQN